LASPCQACGEVYVRVPSPSDVSRRGRLRNREDLLSLPLRNRKPRFSPVPRFLPLSLIFLPRQPRDSRSPTCPAAAGSGQLFFERDGPLPSFSFGVGFLLRGCRGLLFRPAGDLGSLLMGPPPLFFGSMLLPCEINYRSSTSAATFYAHSFPDPIARPRPFFHGAIDLFPCQDVAMFRRS